MATGTYTPTSGTDRTATFEWPHGVSMYGGFPPGGGDGTFAARHPSIFETRLSGDIGTPEDGADNVYHVVTADGAEAPAALDGFTITSGNADQASGNEYGGGLSIEGGNPTIGNCRFSGNHARFGGAIGNVGASPSVINCTFHDNTQAADGLGAVNAGGAAMCNEAGSDPTVLNCTFVHNVAQRRGGGVCNRGGSPTMINCILWGNTDRDGTDESAPDRHLGRNSGRPPPLRTGHRP